jgi:drug/metabolite transporter (DMT)-like permease
MFGLLAAIALDTAVQLIWKTAAARLPDSFAPEAIVTAVIHAPVFIGLAVLILGQLLNWLKVLELADLSFAQPITALSYVSVCMLSALYLGEVVDIVQGIGIVLILAGVWFISRTHSVTPPAKIIAP